ncbi:Alpha/Beta hydrolase protein [Boletus edulis BED1]|uniref:Alpha/Beta hydrolase protein n=1 Tax=Boletus edulis BED1 TaxID=1328754 RepID=A0AAD4GHS9_BOLED|nr:Alpha/Beta hydrolase protein [Boletus edulis BED1]
MRGIDEVQVTQTANGTNDTGWPWPHFPRSDDPSVGVDQQTYDDLVRYTKYASGAYQVLCPRPMGNTLIVQFQNIITSTNGFIARDDNREEFVVAFRGSSDTTTILLDASIILASLKGPGLPPLDPSAESRSAEPRVHVGFLLGYNSVAQKVLNELALQLRAYPSYNIVACGKVDLGSIASIASVAFSHTFPRRCVTLYTFGQPRTGNPPFAELVERAIGTERTYRCVHLVDGVPTMIPTQLGYRHFGAEYWQFTELGAPRNVKYFEGGEDPNGSGNIPSTGVNPAHWVYFLQPIASDPTVCI